jgi:hypothetical protein
MGEGLTGYQSKDCPSILDFQRAMLVGNTEQALKFKDKGYCFIGVDSEGGFV